MACFLFRLLNLSSIISMINLSVPNGFVVMGIFAPGHFLDSGPKTSINRFFAIFPGFQIAKDLSLLLH